MLTRRPGRQAPHAQVLSTETRPWDQRVLPEEATGWTPCFPEPRPPPPPPKAESLPALWPVGRAAHAARPIRGRSGTRGSSIAGSSGTGGRLQASPAPPSTRSRGTRVPGTPGGRKCTEAGPPRAPQPFPKIPAPLAAPRPPRLPLSSPVPKASHPRAARCGPQPWSHGPA